MKLSNSFFLLFWYIANLTTSNKHTGSNAYQKSSSWPFSSEPDEKPTKDYVGVSDQSKDYRADVSSSSRYPFVNLSSPSKNYLRKSLNPNEFRQVIKYLQQGFNLKLDGKDLMLACLQNNTIMAGALINNNSKPIDFGEKYGISPLISACRNDNTEIAEWLINKKANLDLQDKMGSSALMFACINNNTEIATYLINI